jgi:hypothetical protein
MQHSMCVLSCITARTLCMRRSRGHSASTTTRLFQWPSPRQTRAVTRRHRSSALVLQDVHGRGAALGRPVHVKHAKISGDVPTQVSHTMQGRGGGRTRLTLDSELVHQCAMKTDETPSSTACVTTHNWDLDGLKRPGSATFVVHQVHASDDSTDVSADVE